MARGDAQTPMMVQYHRLKAEAGDALLFFRQGVFFEFFFDDPKAADDMLNFFLLEKAFYEIEYELAHRPDRLRVPLAGTLRILAQSPEVS